MEEGGGETSTYPFEDWRYRYIEGIGNNIIIEFVDPTMSGEYHMTMDPSEKDALVYVPNAGLTIAEQMGISAKTNDISTAPMERTWAPAVPVAGKHAGVHASRAVRQTAAPPKVKYKDLERCVSSNIRYNSLPMKVRPIISASPIPRCLPPSPSSFETQGSAIQAKR